MRGNRIFKRAVVNEVLENAFVNLVFRFEFTKQRRRMPRNFELIRARVQRLPNLRLVPIRSRVVLFDIVLSHSFAIYFEYVLSEYRKEVFLVL